MVGKRKLLGHLITTFITCFMAKLSQPHCSFINVSLSNNHKTGVACDWNTLNYQENTSLKAINQKNLTLKWRHNDLDGVSNHRHVDGLPNRSFSRKSKKTSKLRVTGHCEGNSPMTGESPSQRASYAENVSIWWRHHVSHSHNSWVAFTTISKKLPYRCESHF